MLFSENSMSSISSFSSIVFVLFYWCRFIEESIDRSSEVVVLSISFEY
jgi:hypothetical protein